MPNDAHLQVTRWGRHGRTPFVVTVDTEHVGQLEREASLIVAVSVGAHTLGIATADWGGIEIDVELAGGEGIELMCAPRRSAFGGVRKPSQDPVPPVVIWYTSDEVPATVIDRPRSGDFLDDAANRMMQPPIPGASIGDTISRLSGRYALVFSTGVIVLAAYFLTRIRSEAWTVVWWTLLCGAVFSTLLHATVLGWYLTHRPRDHPR